MTLVLTQHNAVSGEDKVRGDDTEQHLLMICTAASMEIATDGTVKYRQLNGSAPGDELVWRLANAPIRVTVTSAANAQVTAAPNWHVVAEPEGTGQVHIDSLASPTQIKVYYNGSPFLGSAFEEHPSVDSGFAIRIALPFWINEVWKQEHWRAQPLYVQLVHLLAHALAVVRQAFDAADPEPWALAFENRFRDAAHMPHRVSNDVRVVPHFDLGGCFIATAAYGSAYEPEVATLRRFRDEVLLPTRTGAAFFREFYRHYYRFSPAIVAAMEREPDLKEMMRWAVTPVVRYLEMALRFPEAPLDAVPEPWRSFLGEMREDLESWTRAVGLPADFAGMSAGQALDEIALALRYLLRSEASRAAYLDQLAARRQIPIRCEAGGYAAARARLLAAGRPEAELARILLPVDTEASA